MLSLYALTFSADDSSRGQSAARQKVGEICQRYGLEIGPGLLQDVTANLDSVHLREVELGRKYRVKLSPESQQETNLRRVLNDMTSPRPNFWMDLPPDLYPPDGPLTAEAERKAVLWLSQNASWLRLTNTRCLLNLDLGKPPSAATFREVRELFRICRFENTNRLALARGQRVLKSYKEAIETAPTAEAKNGYRELAICAALGIERAKESLTFAIDTLRRGR